MRWLGCRGRTRLPPTHRRTEARAAVTGTNATWIGSPPGSVVAPATNAPVGPESPWSEDRSCCGIRGGSRDTRGRTSERGGTRLEPARVLLGLALRHRATTSRSTATTAPSAALRSRTSTPDAGRAGCAMHTPIRLGSHWTRSIGLEPTPVRPRRARSVRRECSARNPRSGPSRRPAFRD